MPNWPTVFKTQQDVKNNLVYWVLVLLVLSSAAVIILFLNQGQRDALVGLSKSIESYGPLSVLSAPVLVGAYGLLAYILVHGVRIHEAVYDRLFIKWREHFDIEFILPQLIEPFKNKLPGNFSDYARRYRYEFMGPYYYFAGDRRAGINETTRIRFYEQVTWYWVTQLNEIFILAFLGITPFFVLLTSGGSFTRTNLASFTLMLLILGVINRWLIRLARNSTSRATKDEIDEILADPKNQIELLTRFERLCATKKL